MKVIGLDIGHSAVKISATDSEGKAKKIMFPSSVSPAIALDHDGESVRAAAETVIVGGRSYFFGETANMQGGDRRPQASTRIGSRRLNMPRCCWAQYGSFQMQTSSSTSHCWWWACPPIFIVGNETRCAIS